MLPKIKSLGKNILCVILEKQVRRLRSRNTFTIIAVAGSVGKTSTKRAVATVVSSKKKTVYQDGNYNDRLTVPLVLFGHAEPSIFNVFAWLRIILNNERQLRRPYPYAVAVLELGTDAPGQIRRFAYLRPELAIVTAVADEHMEYFKTLQAVADEELAVADYSKQLLINADAVQPDYIGERDVRRYGAAVGSGYRLAGRRPQGLHAQTITVEAKGIATDMRTVLLGNQGASITTAAFAAACEVGFTAQEAAAAVASLTPVPGRMQVLAGQNGVTIIDDTYNASPIAVTAALDVLYGADAPQRIAILGSMNELGDVSPAAHQSVGAYCDPTKLTLVVTVGRVAEQDLAPAAVQAGCNVKSFKSPYEAGRYVAGILQPGAVVLAKGSQNGVFAEEAIKSFLQDPADSKRLVRQSPYWMARKRQQFGE
ncbi:MAG: Mur ligase middle domain protein [Candidatus Saccharibacteria bacterium]|nr:Mur ligase middle domain protein [Candidatus Saccharibacteria bacterium]